MSVYQILEGLSFLVFAGLVVLLLVWLKKP